MAVSGRTPRRQHQIYVSDALLALCGDRGEHTASALAAANVRMVSHQYDDIWRIRRILLDVMQSDPPNPRRLTGSHREKDVFS